MYSSRASGYDRLNGPQTWKYLFFGPSQKMFASLCTNSLGDSVIAEHRVCESPPCGNQFYVQEKIKQSKIEYMVILAEMHSKFPDQSHQYVCFHMKRQLVPFLSLAPASHERCSHHVDMSSQLSLYASNRGCEFAFCWLWAIEQVIKLLKMYLLPQTRGHCMDFRVSISFSWWKFSDSVSIWFFSFLNFF